MKPTSGRPGQGGRKPGGTDNDTINNQTPSTDMQPEDAGTADSGNAGPRGPAVESTMRQTSKTDKETGSKR